MLLQSSTNKLLCFVLSLVLVACASNDKPLTKIPKNPALIEVEKLWHAYVGFGPSYRDYRWRIAQDDKSLLVAAKQGKIYRVNKESGSRETIINFDKEITGGLSLESNLLLFGNIDGELVAFNMESREIEWQASLRSEVLHAPISNGRLVAVKTNNGQLWGIELATGIINWVTITNNPPLTTRTKSEPVFAAGVLLSGFETGKLAIINPQNGARVWETSIGKSRKKNSIQQIIDADTSPLFDAPLLYTANLHGSLRAFRIFPDQLPSLAWETDFSTYHNLAIDEQAIFAIDDRSRIFAFAKNTGEELWSNTTLQHHGLGGPFIWKNRLITANTKGHVFFFHPADGKLLARYRVSPYAVSSLLLADEEQLYILDDGGYITALSIATDNYQANK